MNVRYFVFWSVIILIGAAFLCPAVPAEEPVKVLMLSSSAGFEHSVIKRDKGALGHSEKVMLDIAPANGLLVIPTKDGGLIHPKMLAQFDVVMFYTTGDLTKAGKDGSIPMAPESRKALLDWIKAGGGFFGSHTAADTLNHNCWVEDGQQPYIDMIGGEFAWHKSQQVGKLTVKEHAITSHLGTKWDIADEWYYFKNVNPRFKPLLIIDTKSMKEKEYTSQEPYAVSWIKRYGNGRVFSCALGHREDVWTNEKFQQMIVKGIKWAAKKLDD